MTSNSLLKSLDFVRPSGGAASVAREHKCNGAPRRLSAASADSCIIGSFLVDEKAANGVAEAAVVDRAVNPVGGRVKRVFDILAASSAVMLLLPIVLIVVLCIYVTMGRPIFFAQKRVGFRGKAFSCLKFRTMVINAEATLARYLQQNPKAAAEWIAKQKLRKDPRVTSVGHILRLSSLDELPQLINILKGEMSCVGPRPILKTEIARYGDYWKEYVRARPGLTGVWQVSGRSRVGYKARVRLDGWYVQRWSIWLDFAIVAKTIPAVLRFDDTA